MNPKPHPSEALAKAEAALHTHETTLRLHAYGGSSNKIPSSFVRMYLRALDACRASPEPSEAAGLSALLREAGEALRPFAVARADERRDAAIHAVVDAAKAWVAADAEDCITYERKLFAAVALLNKEPAAETDEAFVDRLHRESTLAAKEKRQVPPTPVEWFDGLPMEQKVALGRAATVEAIARWHDRKAAECDALDRKHTTTQNAAALVANEHRAAARSLRSGAWEKEVGDGDV